MSSRPSGYYNSRGGGYRDRDAEAGSSHRRRTRSPEDRERGQSLMFPDKLICSLYAIPGYRSKDGERPRHRDADVDRDVEKDSSYRTRHSEEGARDISVKREEREQRRSRSPERNQQRDQPRPREGFRHAPPAAPRNNMPVDPQRNGGIGSGGRPGNQNGPGHPSGPGYSNGPGYPSGPGYQNQRFEQNRPMDRRAIEEGRRQREMERAVRAQKEEEGGDRKYAVCVCCTCLTLSLVMPSVCLQHRAPSRDPQSRTAVRAIVMEITWTLTEKVVMRRMKRMLRLRLWQRWVSEDSAAPR